MLSSNSEQKYHNAKKANKNYQKFRKKQGQDTTNSVGSLETDLKSDSKEVSNMKFSSQLSQDSGLKSDKPCFSGVVSENKKLNEGTSGLRNPENLQKNEKDLNKTREKLPHSSSQKDFPVLTTDKSCPEAGVQKDNHLSNKINKTNSSKPASVPYRNPYKKKRTDPLLINFQDILSSKRTKRKTRDHNIHKTKAQKHGNREQLSGNILDSSNPIRRRGKHREIKKKKLSNLKTAIIKERIIKQYIRETGTDVDKIDFRAEIKAYLNKLQSMKLKNSKNLNNNLTKNLSDRNCPEEQEDIKNVIIKEDILGVAEDVVEEKGENLKSAVCKIKQEKIPDACKREEIKFTSKFREYCDNFITPELNSAVTELIKGLITLQDRLFLRDPIKAKVRRRHVSGLREARKYLILKRVKMIIIAPNLEKLQMEGSIYDSINELKSMANSQNVPYGFALDRYKMGRFTKKHVPVSAFAVLSYDGIEALYENALQQLMEAKKKFSEVVEANAPKDNDAKDENGKVIASLISAFCEGL